MSVKRFSRVLAVLEKGNQLLRDISKNVPATMIYSMRECLIQFEASEMMCREALEHAKRHKAKAMTTKL